MGDVVAFISLPRVVALADLRRQGVENGRHDSAHNKRPQGTRMRDIGQRKNRRRSRARLRQMVR